MEGRGREWGCGRNASIAAAVLAASVARADGDGANVRLVHVVEKATVARTLDGVVHKLARPECQALVDEFKDASGQPLRTALEASGHSAPEYVAAWIFFYDAPPNLCRTSELARTVPGSRAILVCGSRFARQAAQNSRHAEAILIHEALHSLGLGENPPTSDYITERVEARCER